jgi:hypothetical protein
LATRLTATVPAHLTLPETTVKGTEAVVLLLRAGTVGAMTMGKKVTETEVVVLLAPYMPSPLKEASIWYVPSWSAGRLKEPAPAETLAVSGVAWPFIATSMFSFVGSALVGGVDFSVKLSASLRGLKLAAGGVIVNVVGCVE